MVGTKQDRVLRDRYRPCCDYSTVLSPPAFQQAVAYGKCGIGNDAVQSNRTMYPARLPGAVRRREMTDRTLRAVRGEGARLDDKGNSCEPSINFVSGTGSTLLVKASVERHVAGPSSWSWDGADEQATGGQTVPNSFVSITRNWVSPYQCQHRRLRGDAGGQTARGGYTGAGRGRHKKRRAGCNGLHTGWNIPRRESGLTYDWSLMVRRSHDSSLSQTGRGWTLLSGSVPAEPQSSSLFPEKVERRLA